MKGQINAAANFQIEDFESGNVTETGNFDSLTRDNNDSISLDILNTKLENNTQDKNKKNEMSFFCRRSSSNTLKFSLSENTNQNNNSCAAYNGKSRIPKLLKSRDSVNISLYAKTSSKTQRSSAIDYSAAENIGSQLLNICEGGEGIDKTHFEQEINSLHTKGCLYNILLLQDEKNQDTPLHIAVKKNCTDFVKELLCLLEEPYLSNTFYKRKYFEFKQENEKPLSKVINAKNKDGKDVITLAIEGNNSKCISALFKHLTYENINREKDIESGYTPLHEAVLLGKNEAIKELIKSRHVNAELIDRESYKACNYANDKETIELFIQHYSDEIHNLRKELANSNKKLAWIKRVLNKTKLACVCLAAFSSCFRIYNSHDTISENMLYYSLELLSNTTGLILFFNYLIDTTLSKYEKENSSLNKEFNNYVKERNILENRLRYFSESTFHSNSIRTTIQTPEVILVIPEVGLSYSRL